MDVSNKMCRTRRKLLLYIGLLMICISHVPQCLGAKRARSSASLIARRAGATQYSEHIEESEYRRPHGIHKRLVTGAITDDDIEYQVYQGVMGRAGIDFPVLPGIPHTKFNCRQHGSGYYADLDTDCQVFHICDGGRKISFLCPNGTIFRQTDLICDWWFRVDCLSSPSLYAESTEILSRAQNARRQDKWHKYEPTVRRRPEQRQRNASTDASTQEKSSEFSTVNSEVKVKQPIPISVRKVQAASERNRAQNGLGTKVRSRQYTSYEYNSQQDTASNESFDFEEIPVPPKRKLVYRTKAPIRVTTALDDEHTYRGTPLTFRVDTSTSKESQEFAESASFLKSRGSNGNGYNYEQPDRKVDNLEKETTIIDTQNRMNGEINVEEGNRTESRSSADQSEAFEPTTPITTTSTTTTTPTTTTTTTTQSTTTPTTTGPSTFPRRGSTVYNGRGSGRESGSRKQNGFVSDSRPNDESGVKYTTQAPLDHRKSSQYSTARRLELQKTTPYYTPTIPSISSRATFDSSPPSSKSPSSSISFGSTSTLGSTTTTLFTPSSQSSPTVGVTSSLLFTPSESPSSLPPSTASGFTSSSDTSSSLSSSSSLPTSTVSSTTLLPSTSQSQSPIQVSEHALEMMKTLQELEMAPTIPTSPTPYISQTEKYQPSGQRPGLNIPPSSGPETLHSLALYFANAMENINNSKGILDSVTDGTTLGRIDATTSIADLITEKAKITSALLSEKTVKKYEELFSSTKVETTTIGFDGSTPDLHSHRDSVSSTESNDLEAQYSKNPLFATGGTTQIRELAQVFTHALSAYLQDPVTFKKVLSEIRPTEPSVPTTNDILSNRIGRTEDDNNIFSKSTNGATYLPTVSTTPSSTSTATSEDLEVLDFSDVTLSTDKRDNEAITTELPATTTEEVRVETFEPELIFIHTNRFGENGGKTPASDLITDSQGRLTTKTLDLRTPKSLHTEAQQTTSQEATTTESFDNKFAAEINGGLVMSTMFPYVASESHEITDKAEKGEDSSYFPIKSGEDKTNITLSKPYGLDVLQRKNETSVPLTSIIVENNLPSRWGDDSTTELPSTTTYSPVTLASELKPPLGKNQPDPLKIESLLKPSLDILPPNFDDSEEHLQRAQSQSIVASGNKLINDEIRRKFEESTKTSTTTTTESSTTIEARFDYESQEATSTTMAASGDEATTVRQKMKGHYITKAFPTDRPITTTDAPSTEYVAETTTTFPDTGKFSPNPWSTLAYTIFLDPLTINDGLMNSEEVGTSTSTSNTYLPRGSTKYSTVPYSKEPEVTTESIRLNLGVRNSFDDIVLTNNQDLATRLGKSVITTEIPTATTEEEVEDYKVAMQRRANEIFGGLNDTSADSLMSVMKKADNNKQVRRLILLLIQTCDDDYNTTVEESRKVLLNALIGMDHNDVNGDSIQVVHTRPINRRGGRKIDVAGGGNDLPPLSLPMTATLKPENPSVTTTQSTTAHTESTTFESVETTTNEVSTVPPSIESHTNRFESRLSSDDVITDEIRTTFNEFGKRTTPLASQTTSTGAPQSTTVFNEETTVTNTPLEITTTIISQTQQPETIAEMRKRIGKSLDDYLGQPESSQSDDSHKHSDARALELLKSLYSLAAKWGRRR